MTGNRFMMSKMLLGRREVARGILEMKATNGNIEGEPVAKSENSKFPAKLHFMLSELKADGQEAIASWQPHGRCFMVHKPKDFQTKILPR
jgi:HSF-type DNA-binding